MEEKLVVTTPVEYIERSTSVVKLTSGSVFKIRAMNAYTTVAFIDVMNKYSARNADKVNDDEKDPMGFIRENIEFLTKIVVMKSIVEPNVPEESLMYVDVVELLGEIMNLTGLGSEQREEREGFREDSDRTEP